jgi:NitT/TauT family transport system substrate-binding protein
MTRSGWEPSRRRLLVGGVSTIALSLAPVARPAKAAQKVRVMSNWMAESVQGGYYQALAAGLYEREGLDVDITMGGPQVNGMQLLTAGRADLLMGHAFRTLNAVEQGLPVIAVATCFQSDLQCIVAYDDVKRLSDLKGKKVLISTSSRTTFWPWLKAKYGMTDDQLSPYSLQSFLTNKDSAIAGLISDEPYEATTAGAKNLTSFLLAKEGYPPYGAPLLARLDFYKDNRDVVRRFVRATMEGWRDYIRDPAAANRAIRAANSEQSDGMLDYGLKTMREFNVLGGGDAATRGIGIMTDARWKETAEFMMEYGLLKKTMDWKAAYTTEFVEGLDIKI